jgi:hypothetical protein
VRSRAETLLRKRGRACQARKQQQNGPSHQEWRRQSHNIKQSDNLAPKCQSICRFDTKFPSNVEVSENGSRMRCCSGPRVKGEENYSWGLFTLPATRLPAHKATTIDATMSTGHIVELTRAQWVCPTHKDSTAGRLHAVNNQQKQSGSENC